MTRYNGMSAKVVIADLIRIYCTDMVLMQGLLYACSIDDGVYLDNYFERVILYATANLLPVSGILMYSNEKIVVGLMMLGLVDYIAMYLIIQKEAPVDLSKPFSIKVKRALSFGLLAGEMAMAAAFACRYLDADWLKVRVSIEKVARDFWAMIRGE